MQNEPEMPGLGDLRDRLDEAIERLSITIEAINAEDDQYLNVDAMGELHLRVASPTVLAHILIQNLHGPMSGHSDFDLDEKEFWLRVAGELGPAWVAKFRRIGAFMALVEKA